MLLPLDVVIISDEIIRPPGPKMVACICPEHGFYFRINTKPKWQTPVLLQKAGVHDFLDHDSYLECGSPIELDDYVIENTGNRGKVIGAIAAAVVPKIVEAIKASPDVRASDKQAMLAALGFV